MSDKPFIIYKSSAGSGKTYTLTLEYLKLALRQPPTAFKQILAVTFTNKATQEMKERILDVLSRLSQQVDEAEFMDQELMKFLQVDAEGLKHKAKATLTAILHDYSHFSVSTIDSFFQKVVRAFAREIDLNAKFEVELDQDGVLERVVDRVVMQVMDDEFLHKWLVDYATEQIQNGKTWDIRRNIQGLGKQIFQENFKQHAGEIKSFLSEKENVDQLQKLVKSRRDGLIKIGKDLKQQANEIRVAHGLAWTDFSGSSNSFAKKFDQLGDRNKVVPDITKTMVEAIDNPGKWYAKSSKKINEIESAFQSGLNDILRQFEPLLFQWNTISAISRNIYVYGVFRNLLDDLSLIKSEENMLLISDANEFLKEITYENDAPFIYEKVGNQYQHFLIDEFQDTSGFQWASFKPLLENSLSFGHRNLLVGDVKQSIYRWRGGEMKLLLERVEEEIGAHLIKTENLDTNYRSLPRIIEFNNALFETLPTSFERVLSDTYGVDDPSILSKAYADVKQKVSSKKKQSNFQGMVRMEFLEENKELEEDGKFDKQVLEKIPEQVRKLQDLGYQLKDIAFLVRTKSEGEQIADCLMLEVTSDQYRYDVLSDESMYLHKAASVKALVAALSYLYQPDDEVQFKTMWYYRAVLLDQKVDHKLFSLDQIDEDFAKEIELFKAQEQVLLQLSLLEMTEELIRILRIQETGLEKAYISGFREAVFDFISKNRSDLGAFLDWWQDNKQKRTVKIPEGHDAMRILTIHKSKGLQFKVVLMPFLKWTIFDTTKDNIVWAPFKDSDTGIQAIIPLKLQSSLAQSLFAETYGEEAILAYLDSLNMIYVALTRAEEVFWSLSPYKGSFNSQNYLEIHLQQILEGGIQNLGTLEQESKIFQWGDWPESNIPDQTVFQTPPLRWTYKKWQELLEVKQYAVDFSAEGMEQRKKRNFGLLVHEILEKSNTLAQAKLELESLYFEGRLSSEEKEEVLSQLQALFENPLFASWFDPAQDSLNEQGILLPGGKQKRPDRILLHQREAVVVDFKTGEERDSYSKQVKEYMELVKSLTAKPCKGYLCYLETGKIEEVHA
ncbi:UvrD-helicase domain-containing protein [Algoriphagus algorifonticola]|uniref:UvrD-helicase domain-containing protein n=1 Tax=Algoriphagus algorifonticola TaxID=2593007 RepID=UPI0011A80636|nr:UvrD-helicase domain-containing protein [Algoriphagus algorifonticola]